MGEVMTELFFGSTNDLERKKFQDKQFFYFFQFEMH